MSLERDNPLGQPDDGATVLAWRFKHEQAHGVRFRLEYVVGGTAVVIPTDQLAITPPPAPQADDSWLGNSDKNAGYAYRAVWNHSQHLGEVEVRDIAIQVRFDDADRAEDIAVVAVLLDQQTIGREPGTIRDLSVAHTGDDETPIEVKFTYDDGGDDEAHFAMGYRLAAGGAFEAPSPAASVSRGVPEVRDGRVLRRITLTLDPALHKLPFGEFDAFEVQVSAIETYARFPESPQVPGVRASLPAERIAAIRIGKPPLILSVTVPDPALNRTGGEANDEPRLVVPITFRLASRSSRVQRIRFAPVYSASGAPFGFCTLRNDDPVAYPRTAREITLQPGESRFHYLLWNVVADEGLGIRIGAGRLAQVRLDATVAEPLAARPLSASLLADNTTTLSTPAFVRFQEKLVDPAELIMSASNPTSTRTRDVFFTHKINVAQEFFISVDQQFAACVVPGLLEYDVRRQQGVTNGFGRIFPTDFADGPDCVGRAGNRFFHFAWPLSGGEPAVDEVLPSPVGGESIGGTREEFVFTSNGRPLTAILFHSAERQNNTTNEGIVYLMTIARDQVLSRWITASRGVTRILPRKVNGGPEDVAFQIVVGDFDGDPTNSECVVANRGIERAMGANEGWFHWFAIREDLAGGIVFEGPFDLPRPPFGAPGDNTPDRALGHWSLVTYADPSNGNRPALLLSRTFARDTRPAVHAFDLLRQRPGGGFAQSTWEERLPVLTDANPDILGKNLRAVFASDLDGGLGGTTEPELVAVIEKPTGPDPFERLDMWLLVRRGATREWRQTVREVAPGRPSALRFNDRMQLVDVNGDDFLDLLIQQEDADSRGYYYFSSALTGVAGGFGLVPDSAQADPCLRPGVSDLNQDGYPDILSAGVLHTGKPTGEYDRRLGEFAGQERPTATYLVEQMFDVGVDRRPNQDFVAVTDGSGAHACVQSVLWDGGNPQRGPQFALVAPSVIRSVAPFVPPGRAGTGSTKDLAVVSGDGEEDNRLYRMIFDGTAFTGGPWAGFSIPIRRDVVALRTEPLDADEDASRNAKVQDLAVAQARSNLIQVLRGSDGYAEAIPVAVGSPGEVVLRLSAASATDDQLEDVLALTSQGDQLRLWCVPRAVGGGFGAPILYLQFDDSPASDLRGLGFNRDARQLAQGILVFENQVRFVLPRVISGQCSSAMIRSRLPQPFGNVLFDLQVTDFDRDGQVEVTGGSISPATGGLKQLLRVDRAYRSTR